MNAQKSSRERFLEAVAAWDAEARRISGKGKQRGKGALAIEADALEDATQAYAAERDIPATGFRHVFAAWRHFGLVADEALEAFEAGLHQIEGNQHV